MKVKDTVIRMVYSALRKKVKRCIWLLTAALFASVLLTPGAWAQQEETGAIEGRIEYVSGEPLSGAVVYVAGNEGVRDTTDLDGHFSLEEETAGQTLKVTLADGSVGRTLKIKFGRGRSRTIEASREGLSIPLVGYEEVPVGYNEFRSRRELTSSIGTAEYSEFEDHSVLNPENALIGQVPGLIVLGNGGLPPTAVDMFIRGRGTFSSSAPLVLVDGFERPLSSLSLIEIESVSVLKDAAALAKYGQRGANGVVLVETKRGMKQGLEVTASTEIGLTRPTRLPDFLGSPMYARALSEAQFNDGQTPLYNLYDVQAFEAGNLPSEVYPNVDWFNEVLRNNGYRTNTRVTFRGGGEATQFFTALSFVNDRGLFQNRSIGVNSRRGLSTQAEYSRFNLRTNLDVDITDNLLMQVDLSGNLTENNRAAGVGQNAFSIFNQLYSVPPAAFPVKVSGKGWGGDQQFGTNPVSSLAATGAQYPNSREFSLTGRLRRNMSDMLEGLGVEVTASYNNYGQFFEEQTRPSQFFEVNPVRGPNGVVIDTTVAKFGQDQGLSYNDFFSDRRQYADVVGKADYTRSWGERHDLDAMVLFHQALREFDGQNEKFHQRNFVANAHVGLSGKYFFDVTASYSGTNALPEGERYGLFPAISAGWLLSEEDFFGSPSFLNRLKLRASWGMAGRGDLPLNRPFEESFSGAGGYWFRDSNDFEFGFAESRLASSDFTYETSYKTNVGIDATLFSQINFTVDAFYNRRTNILTSTGGALSDVIGQTAPLESVGIVDNRGFETALTWQGEVGDLGYHLGGQFSLAKNEVKEQAEQPRTEEYLRRTGEQVGQWFGLEAIGFFEDQEDIANSPDHSFGDVQPGDIKYKDQNGDGLINELDQVPIGHAPGYPEIYFAATMGADYKGLSISALFQGTGNHTAYLNTQGVFRPLQNGSTISDYYYANRWTQGKEESAKFPRLTTEENDNNFQPNSIWLRDRSYLKLRLLEVAYELPSSLTQSLRIDKLRVFVRGRNLFSIDNIPELDPEQLSAAYPVLRSYNAGLKVSF